MRCCVIFQRRDFGRTGPCETRTWWARYCSLPQSSCNCLNSATPFLSVNATAALLEDPFRSLYITRCLWPCDHMLVLTLTMTPWMVYSTLSLVLELVPFSYDDHGVSMCVWHMQMPGTLFLPSKASGECQCSWHSQRTLHFVQALLSLQWRSQNKNRRMLLQCQHRHIASYCQSVLIYAFWGLKAGYGYIAQEPKVTLRARCQSSWSFMMDGPSQ